MKTAFLSLGSNLGDCRLNLENAVTSLDTLISTRVLEVSDIYLTSPVGFSEQPDFLNICVKIETDLSPYALLGACLGIEAAMGRRRLFKNGPRIIDVDVLMYEGAKLSTKELTLPHEHLRERAFVLVPLKDVLPEMKFEGLDLGIYANSIDSSGVKRASSFPR